MSFDEIVTKVIKIMGLTEYHRETVETFVLDGIDNLRCSGVKDSIIYSKRCIGLLTQYTTDNWNYNPGQGRISESFEKRVIQLTLAGDDEDV